MVNLHYRDIKKISRILESANPSKPKGRGCASLPLSKRPLPNFFDKEKLTRLYDNIDNVNVMMACFVADIAGLRISEVCDLKDINVNLEDSYIKVNQGKGKKDRIVKIVNPAWLRTLAKWKRMRGESEHFIPSLDDRKNKLSDVVLSGKHKEALKKSGLDIELKKRGNGQMQPMYSFHTHRHTYATNLLRWGFEISMVQQQLGHTDISITMRYNELTRAHIEERAEKIFGKQRKEDKIEMIQNVTDPLQLLQIRLAKGEITTKKYNELLITLKPEAGTEIKRELGYIG